MRGPHSSFATAILTLLCLGLSVPLVGQEARPGWTLTAGAGYATHFDEPGSFSVAASGLQARSRTLSLGVEAGYDRHQAFEQSGEFWWNGINGTSSSECPAPCTLQRVRWTEKHDDAAWHFGALLRYRESARVVAPTVELGVGLYGFRSSGGRDVRDATSGAPVPELSGEGSSTQVAPGMSAAFGVDVFPGNGRIGVGAVAHFRGAALPTGDGLFAAGYASLQARVTIR